MDIVSTQNTKHTFLLHGIFCLCSLPVLPLLGLCANVYRQGSHPHWSVWQHVYICQEKMLPGATGVWIHMAGSKSHNSVNSTINSLSFYCLLISTLVPMINQ